MKSQRYLMPLAALFYTVNATSQVKFSDTALYKVTYAFSFSYDTTDLSKKFTEDMHLYAGQSYSVFRDAGYDLYEQERIRQMKQIMDQIKTHDLSKPITRNGGTGNISQTEVFKKINGNTVYKKEALAGRNYLIEDNLPVIQWQTDAETKMFGDIRAQKAHGNFRGRRYTAWFAPQFPVSAGPWKLYGLPGIILEAWDEKKEVMFLFRGVQQLQEQAAVIIRPPVKYTSAKEDEYERLHQLYLEYPQAFIASRNTALGITVTVDGKSLESIRNNQPRKKAVKPQVNNVLELQKP
jgi:GLPGLI family protein